MPIIIREARGATVAPSTSGRIKVGLITPGLGSSGYYSQPVLENAAAEKVWPKGTRVFFDHPSESELHDRPERSVRDLAAVLAEDAHWDGTGLVAEADVIGPYRELVTDPVFADSVGMSIRATAEARAGEVDGKTCTIITRLVEGLSVDLVTQAGRGGRILAVLESARATLRRASEATANDTRAALDAALTGLYGGEKVWIWVRDFDEATVWFTHETADTSATYAQAYSLDATGAAILAGERTEVRVHTQYVPVGTTPAAESGPPNVSAPAGQPQSPNPQSEEDNMGTIQVDEAQHALLTEAAGRVPTLETELDAAQQRADAAEQQLRARDNEAAARAVIAREAKGAGVEFTALESRGLLAGLPLGESGTLDEATFVETVKAGVAEKAATTRGATITGFGAPPTTTDWAMEAEKAAAAAFGRQIKEA